MWNRARGFALHQAAMIIPYYIRDEPTVCRHGEAHRRASPGRRQRVTVSVLRHDRSRLTRLPSPDREPTVVVRSVTSGSATGTTPLQAPHHVTMHTATAEAPVTPREMQKRTFGVVLASGRESADHQLVDAHLFFCSFDGESAVQAFAQT